ncbi:recombinase family protein [Pseudomonas putida]|uniref:recombinase family protein n=1 Tax=Pseudomonas putida TaxID=303 RepID=UPI0021564229|nr:recombinase family protein [Pseudomonas putida]
MSKVFSYIRFSSAKQSAGDSYARQVKAAKAFCDEHGLELADSREYLFFDKGRSAFKGRHLDDTGELARFLGYVEDGTIPAGSYLVVESLDRLSRERVRDALPRFLDLLAKGINVYTSVDKRLYTKDYNELDLIISIISMSRAHEESATKGGRVSSAWRAKQKEARTTGKPLGKNRPLWLDVTPDGYVLNPGKAAIVHRIFDLSTKGHGSRIIAATLNQEGIPAFSAGRKNFSGLWGFSTVRHILDSRTVLGEYQPHIFIDGKRTPDGEPIKDYFPSVVTENEFYLAQAARTSRKTHSVTNATTNFNVLAGILNCYKCGSAMHLQGQRGRKYYKCSKTTRGLCDAGIISAPRTEEVFKDLNS